MSSFMDRMKGRIQAAGKGAQKLSEVANLKLDLREARSTLDARCRDLGKVCAKRFLDDGEERLPRDEPAIRTLLDEIERKRKRVQGIEAELEQLKEN